MLFQMKVTWEENTMYTEGYGERSVFQQFRKKIKEITSFMIRLCDFVIKSARKSGGGCLKKIIYIY